MAQTVRVPPVDHVEQKVAIIGVFDRAADVYERPVRYTVADKPGRPEVDQ